MTDFTKGAGITGALFLFLLVPDIAGASGGFDCTVDDKRAAFAVRGGIPHGMPAKPFQVEGTLTLRAAKVAGDLREGTWTGEHLVQNWLDGRDFRLNFYRERAGDGPFGSVELVITTRRADEFTYRGDYEVRVYEAATGEDGAVRLKGKVACSLE